MSLYLIITMLISACIFILCAVLGWLVNNYRFERLNVELQKKKDRYMQLKEKYIDTTKFYQTLEEEYHEMDHAVHEMKDKLDQLKSKYAAIKEQNKALQRDLHKVKSRLVKEPEKSQT